MRGFKFTKKRKVVLNLVNFLIFGSLIFLILFSSNIIEVSKEHADHTLRQQWQIDLPSEKD